MSDTPFRVLLDLTDLHIESFKYVWISISPREIKTISDFKASILHKINLSTDNIKLFVRGGLLLDDETVFVLREDDTVHVQNENFFSFQDQGTSATKEHKRFSRKRESSECNQEEFLNSKKHKRNSDFSAANENAIYLEDTNCKAKKKCKKKPKFHNVTSYDEESNSTIEPGVQSSLTHKDKKRKQNSSKEINLSDSSLLQSCNSNFLFETESSLAEKSKKKTMCKADSNIDPFYSAKKDTLHKDKAIIMKKSEVNQLEVGNNEVEKTEIRKTFTECNTGLPNNCPKKKRKRRKKRKSIPEHDVAVLCSANNDEEFKSFINSYAECSKGKHVIFGSINPVVEALPETSPQVETLDTGNDEKVQNASTETYVVDDLSPPNYPKVSTPAQSNACLNPNWQVSLMQNENLNHSYNKTCSSRKETTSIHSKTTSDATRALTHNPEEEIPHKVKYEDLPILHSQPKIGAHIAYKVLELGENYSPVVSEYREGIVRSINPLSEEIEIELLKHEIKPGRTGKFEILKEDEMPLPEVKKTDAVVWSSLIEPKLLS